MLDNTESADLAALLVWYREMGVDQVVGEAAVDWLARGDKVPGDHFKRPPLSQPTRPVREPAAAAPAQAPAWRPAPPVATPRQFPATAPDAAVMAARSAAREAATLDELACQARRLRRLQSQGHGQKPVFLPRCAKARSC